MGWLRCSLGVQYDIRIKIHIKPLTKFIVSPDRINIYADHGPDIYQADEKITISVRTNNRDWIVNVIAEPLIYQGSDSNEQMIEPEFLLVSLNGENGEFISLEDGFTIYGSNYNSCGTDIDLYVKARTLWEHQAGVYTGNLCFTLAPE